LFLSRKRLKIDLGEMEKEGGSISSFLEASLKVKVTPEKDKIFIDSEKFSPEELKRQVTKFIYRRHLNGRYFAEVEGSGVKIHEFEAKKSEKRKKPGIPPSTIKHGW